MQLSSRSLFLAALLQAASHVAAVRLSVRGEPASPSHLARRDHISGLDNGQNIQYYTNVTLGGALFSVEIDTGSSDLWVAGDVPHANNTGISSGVTYAIGAVKGTVATAPLEFAGYTVPNQAFLQVPTSATNPAGQGLIGLGPNTGSNVHIALKNQPAGDAVLDRIFRQNVTTPNYISVLLGRSNDPDELFPGDVTIAELIPGYESITNTTKVNVTSVPSKNSGSQHWQVLLDVNGIVGPDGNPVNVSSQVATTSNKKQLTAIFDTGFTLPQVPKYIADAIYSRFEGAQYQNLSSTGPIWTLPCDVEVNITFKIGGQAIPIHPLDTNLDLNLQDNNGNKICVGSFQPITTAESPVFDVILGMAFRELPSFNLFLEHVVTIVGSVRNSYLLVNYGDFVDGTTSKASPYVQLLSVTDTALAHTDFVDVRLNGIDRTSDQRMTAGVNPAPPNTTNQNNNSFFTRHRTAIIIGAAAAGGLLLLLLGGATLSVIRRRNRRAQPVVGLAPSAYRPLHEPAPAGEMYQVQGYQAGARATYASPWDRR
ncbi:acid protease [Artomyces pyxidatus]|uniref:Acid protease n=1 Tax=Artomyces pyxidatus TaxID=48021 RepID=A0ACB8T6R9_9AGAM|nr:acid protease [Artomyces pyxidatus]